MEQKENRSSLSIQKDLHTVLSFEQIGRFYAMMHKLQLTNIAAPVKNNKDLLCYTGIITLGELKDLWGVSRNACKNLLEKFEILQLLNIVKTPHKGGLINVVQVYTEAIDPHAVLPTWVYREANSRVYTEVTDPQHAQPTWVYTDHAEPPKNNADDAGRVYRELTDTQHAGVTRVYSKNEISAVDKEKVYTEVTDPQHAQPTWVYKKPTYVRTRAPLTSNTNTNTKKQKSIKKIKKDSPKLKPNYPLHFHQGKLSIQSRKVLARSEWYDKKFHKIFIGFLEYKRYEKNQIYKTEQSTKRVFTDLVKFSNNDVDTAKEIINTTIRNLYTGIFPLDKKNNNQRTSTTGAKEKFNYTKS